MSSIAGHTRAADTRDVEILAHKIRSLAERQGRPEIPGEHFLVDIPGNDYPNMNPVKLTAQLGLLDERQPSRTVQFIELTNDADPKVRFVRRAAD